MVAGLTGVYRLEAPNVNIDKANVHTELTSVGPVSFRSKIFLPEPGIEPQSPVWPARIIPLDQSTYSTVAAI